MNFIRLLTICLATVCVVFSDDSIEWIELPGTDRSNDTRVVNGNLAGRGQFPWHATVLVRRADDSWIFCAGALLSRNTVLTHADCVVRSDAVLVLLGTNSFNTGLRIPINRFTVHPRYNTNGNRHSFFNIAVLRLSQRVNLSRSVQPISLPARKFEFFAFENQLSRFAGFGSNSASNPNQKLRWGSFRVATIANCSITYPLPTNVNHMILCVRNEGSRRAHPGYGDIGGPLVWRWRNRNYVIGIFAMVPDNSNLSRGPAGFINIAAHSQWVASIVRDAAINPGQPTRPPNGHPTPPNPSLPSL